MIEFPIDPGAFLRRLPLQPRDLVLLSGSIIEGIGNATSDYDLLVIGDELPRDIPSGVDGVEIVKGRLRYFHSSVDKCRKPFGVGFYRREEIAELGRVLDAAHEASMTPSKTFSLPHPWLDEVVHKMAVSRCILNAGLRDDVFAFISFDKYNFLKYRETVPGFDLFQDIAGSWQSHQYDTSIHHCREYLSLLAQNLSHLNGNTNYKRKWLLENIKRLGCAYPALCHSLLDWFWADRRSETHRRNGVLHACDLADQIFCETTACLRAKWSAYDWRRILAQPHGDEGVGADGPDRLTRERAYWRQVFAAGSAPLRRQLCLDHVPL